MVSATPALCCPGRYIFCPWVSMIEPEACENLFSNSPPARFAMATSALPNSYLRSPVARISHSVTRYTAHASLRNDDMRVDCDRLRLNRQFRLSRESLL